MRRWLVDCTVPSGNWLGVFRKRPRLEYNCNVGWAWIPAQATGQLMTEEFSTFHFKDFGSFLYLQVDRFLADEGWTG